MKVLRVIVDEIPTNCGECVLMQYINDSPKCCGIQNTDDNKYHNDIAGNPYDMTYRRSDCPLAKETQNNADN